MAHKLNAKQIEDIIDITLEERDRMLVIEANSIEGRRKLLRTIRAKINNKLELPIFRPKDCNSLIEPIDSLKNYV